MANRRICIADRVDSRASRAATSKVCLSVGAIACRAAPSNIATASAYVHTRNTCRSTRGQAFVTNDSTISDLSQSSPPSWSSPDGASGVQTNCNRRSFVYDAIKDVENIGHNAWDWIGLSCQRGQIPIRPTRTRELGIPAMATDRDQFGLNCGDRCFE
jgi:hypothetical protein